ncbi:Myosin type-2 heavy chain 1 [Clydaea vesicula]|uniref:Myosin type-2 heavy chain 1 n=1 Tax=Clydaea vesicula TaxID=447962 RepID=A0AAD5XW91_9FUNG|nr:Myosin type-2 heavy chain 1 [Clydaea vesicula]
MTSEYIMYDSRSLDVFVKDTRAWFSDDQEGWIVGFLLSKEVNDGKVKLIFKIGSRGKDHVFETTMDKLEKSKFADLPHLKNPPMLEGIDDLANLSYLHEPAVLHNVRLRYSQEQIYTYSGIVLIAMNPFARLSIYTADIMREYSGKRRGELEPHLFAVAEEAYRAMLREKKNQSIIVSGESGAGKTQSAKYIMRYFATVDDLDKSAAKPFSRSGSAEIGTPTKKVGGTSEIEEAVLSTNPIMESFGNSKTTRNDNSSRFGKYIEIMFSKPQQNQSVKIVGAKIRTYLLERSRLVFQPISERNYHIFYQMCAGVPAAERKELGLTSWESFVYLNQGKAGNLPGMDDGKEFKDTQNALSTVGISVSAQWDIFKICAALLHIGNIKITASRDEAQIDDNDPALIQAAKLLGVNQAEFKKWIVKKQITTRSEKIVTALNQYQATVGRDSVAKFIYSMLFDWLVKVTNINLSNKDEEVGSFIGNYANEKLQQEFNRHIFKLEQQDYIAEEITWSFIDFNDNQPCIDMIENKLGILDLLDEESRLPSGSDQSLITKLYQRFAVPSQAFFEKPRFGQQAFTIKHYATDVTYDIDGFIEKNKDTVSDEQLANLNASELSFLREVIKIEPLEVEEKPVARAGTVRGGSAKKPTLGSIFKSSLISLMDTIRTTDAHYIRCIKPNQSKSPFGFEPQMVLQQLRACGVLETIRISCAGYPSKWAYQEFADRYYLLTKSTDWKSDPQTLTNVIVKKNITSEDRYQTGLTKIFFRAGQLAQLEKLRTDRLNYCVVLIQKIIKSYVYRKKFLLQKKSAITIQRIVRGCIARRAYNNCRRELAAIKIQKTVRGWLAHKKYLQTRSAIIKIQAVTRMFFAYRKGKELRRRIAAINIQRCYRGYVARKWYKKTVRRIVLVQSCTRRRAAMKELKKLKIEARGIDKIREKSYALENKVVELSQQTADLRKEKKSALDQVAALEAQVASWKEKYASVADKNKTAAVQLTEDTTSLKNQLHELQQSTAALTKENEKMINVIKKKDDDMSTLEEELLKSKEEVKKLREELKSAPKQEDVGTVSALKKEVTSLRDQMGKLLSGKWRADRAENANGYTDSSYSYTSPTAVNGRTPYPNEETPSPLNRYSISRITDESRRRASARASLLNEKDSGEGVLENERSIRILEDKALEDEIIESLITTLRIPLPSTQTVATRREIFFPSHLIGSVMTQLISNDLSARMQILMANVMKAIQTLTMKFEDDYVSAFWLSNCFELLCVVKTTQDKQTRLQNRIMAQQNTEKYTEVSEIDRSLDKVRNDLDYLLIEIFHGWIKELKKRLSNMIVPAVIENQSLPGYICKQSGGLWGKWGKTSTSSQFTIEQLLNFLSKLNKTMRCYYMEESMSRQILTELLRVIGVSSFNHILMRKNFCTWKRGVQIQFNVSRLEEWCTSNGIAEATLHLQQLLQAAKLLTLNKTSPQDIETIFDVCFLLNPTQIKKLLSLYYAADFDSPLSPELLKIVANRAVLNEKSDNLLLDLEQYPDFIKPNPRTVEAIDKFIPSWIDLDKISAVVASMS